VKVWLCYDCYFNGCDEWKSVVKIVDDEVKALLWQEEVQNTDRDYRYYEEKIVE
jgi:hypothetical protein